MKKMKVGIDNYGLSPLGFDPLETLQWAKKNGAEGVQFSGLRSKKNSTIDTGLLKDLKDFAADNSLYLEWGGGQHIPFDMLTWKSKDTFPINRKAAEEASFLNTRIVRSCSGGLMRWKENSPDTEVFIKAMADSLRAQRSMLKDHNVILALETHFEFTTYELLCLFEKCDAKPGEYLGICLDTMNLLTMLEEPEAAVKRILPWIVSTHIKDGGIIINREGIMTFPVEIGKGVIELKKIISLISSLSQEINLSIEDHGGSFFLPIFNESFMSRFPDLTLQEFTLLVKLAAETQTIINKGELVILERKKWPQVCEEQIKRDIRALKAIT